MLDAYIIEEIKRQEEARRRAESEGRPRVHIERESPRQDPIEDESPGIEGDDRPLRIDIDPGIPIRPPLPTGTEIQRVVSGGEAW